MNIICSFLKDNYISIAVIVTIVFVLLIIISIREWDLNPPKPDTKLVQEVVVETFKNEKGQKENEMGQNEMELLGNKNNAEIKELQTLKLSPSDSFCQNPNHYLEKK